MDEGEGRLLLARVAPAGAVAAVTAAAAATAATSAATAAATTTAAALRSSSAVVNDVDRRKLLSVQLGQICAILLHSDRIHYAHQAKDGAEDCKSYLHCSVFLFRV